MTSDFTSKYKNFTSGFTSKNEALPKYDIEDVQQHKSTHDCWVINEKNIYDVTHFIGRHPGGSDVIHACAGSDITAIMDNMNPHKHSIHAYNLLNEYKVGELRIYGESSCEDLCDVQPNDLNGWKEDLIDWNKGLLFQVHKLGTDYLKWVHSPVNKKLKLFDSQFIEFFSRTKWYIIPMLWLPVVVLCSIFSFRELAVSLKKFPDINNDSTNNFLIVMVFSLLFIIGIPLWTLVEYLLHRHLFHMEPRGDSPAQITLHFFFHGLHHKVPFDEERLVFPPVAASVFIFFFWSLMKTCFPGGFGTSVFGGGLLGYIYYDLIHYYMHHGAPRRGTYLHNMKYNHVLHHFNDPTKGFGISTRFWDLPFNTVNKINKD